MSYTRFAIVWLALLAGAWAEEYPLRTWTSTSGQQIVARYLPEKRPEVGWNYVPLQTEDGRQVVIALSGLSREDLDWIAGLASTLRTRPGESAPVGLFKADLADFSEEWKRLESCRLLEHPANDGDSFHVLGPDGAEYIFRLHGVDTPESVEDETLESRIEEQAAYFGIRTEKVTRYGHQAASFTQKQLKEPFTVLTRMQSAMGRSKLPRYYAFVVTSNGEDLARVLLANGLARAFGAPVRIGRKSADELEEELQDVEHEARKAGRGIWGGNAE